MSERDYFLVTVNYDGPDGRAVVITEKLAQTTRAEALAEMGGERVFLCRVFEWNAPPGADDCTHQHEGCGVYRIVKEADDE